MSEDYLIKRLRENGGIICLAAAARIESLQAERDAAVLAERETCARICEDANDDIWDKDTGEKVYLDSTAGDIRARSNKEPEQ